MFPPELRISFEDETFTMAGTARFTTGANLSSKETLEVVAETWDVLPVLEAAQEPTADRAADAMTTTIVAVETAT
jgi:hypothetical protein